MAQQLFSLTSDQLSNATFVGFRGKEQLCRPYEYEFYFTVPAGTSVRALVGERATIKGDRQDDREPLVIHGVVAAVHLLHQAADRALYRALLVPKLWLLRHFWRSYVFTGKQIEDVLTETLLDAGLQSSDFRFRIDDATYGDEEFIAQYRETHLDFFHRWLEREGLYYYFEHNPDEQSEILVIVDDKSHIEDFPSGGAVRYVPTVGDEGGQFEGLHQIESDVRWLPKSVTLADYDYANPAVSLQSDSDVTAQGIGKIREYGYRAFGDKDLKRLTKVKAQAIGCRESTLRAKGNVMGPRAGYRMKVEDQPDDLGEEWLVVDLEMQGAVAGTSPEMAALTSLPTKHVFDMKVFALPADVQYRAPQSTPWPRIYGFENAVVCGEADSPYAQIDADGRYLVRFEFDTSDLPDAKASTRVRMLQPHGGANEGFHFPLRKGTEVMISFLGGDPDRPFIAGVVPNAQKPSVVGERNHTQNIIRTGSNNQIVMEDRQGQEFVFVHTPNMKTGIYMGHPAGEQGKLYTGDGEQPTTAGFTSPAAVAADDTNIVVDVPVSLYQTTEGNAALWVGGDYWENLWSNYFSFVYSNTAIGYFGTFTFNVGKAANETYHQSRTTTTLHGRTDTVLADGKTQDITPFLHQTIHGSGWQRVDSAWEHRVGAKNTDKYGSWKSDVAGAWNANFSDGSVKLDVTPGTFHMTATTEIKLVAPSAKIKATGKILYESDSLTIEKSSSKHEFYDYKGASGNFKTDHAVFYQSTYGIKLDTAAMKVENKGAKKETFGVLFKQAGADLKNGGATIKTLAVDLWNGAFKKT